MNPIGPMYYPTIIQQKIVTHYITNYFECNLSKIDTSYYDEELTILPRGEDKKVQLCYEYDVKCDEATQDEDSFLLLNVYNHIPEGFLSYMCTILHRFNKEIRMSDAVKNILECKTPDYACNKAIKDTRYSTITWRNSLLKEIESLYSPEFCEILSKIVLCADAYSEWKIQYENKIVQNSWAVDYMHNIKIWSYNYPDSIMNNLLGEMSQAISSSYDKGIVSLLKRFFQQDVRHLDMDIKVVIKNNLEYFPSRIPKISRSIIKDITNNDKITEGEIDKLLQKVRSLISSWKKSNFPSDHYYIIETDKEILWFALLKHNEKTFQQYIQEINMEEIQNFQAHAKQSVMKKTEQKKEESIKTEELSLLQKREQEILEAINDDIQCCTPLMKPILVDLTDDNNDIEIGDDIIDGALYTPKDEEELLAKMSLNDVNDVSKSLKNEYKFCCNFPAHLIIDKYGVLYERHALLEVNYTLVPSTDFLVSSAHVYTKLLLLSQEIMTEVSTILTSNLETQDNLLGDTYSSKLSIDITLYVSLNQDNVLTVNSM